MPFQYGCVNACKERRAAARRGGENKGGERGEVEGKRERKMEIKREVRHKASLWEKEGQRESEWEREDEGGIITIHTYNTPSSVENTHTHTYLLKARSTD